MRLPYVLRLFILVAPLRSGAGDLKRAVLENEVGGTRVAGVEISASGANSYTTKRDWQFTRWMRRAKASTEVLDIYQRFAAQDPERFQSDTARVKELLQELVKRTLAMAITVARITPNG